MAEAYIYDAVRTPRGKGRATGALHTTKPITLLTTVLDAIKDRHAGLEPSEVDVEQVRIDPDIEPRPWLELARAEKALAAQRDEPGSDG